MKLEANGIDIEVEDSGPTPAGRPVVLLIMGLGMQLIAWPAPFVQALVDAGFRVVRYDNRDIGLSQGFDDAGSHSLLWESLRARIGLPVRSAYSVQDMANDALGVLDAMNIRQAHVIGVSMGGMIAQRLAASAPARVASLVSIMSSSGARGLPGPSGEIAMALLKRPAGSTEAALLAHSLAFIKLIASPGFAQDTEGLAAGVTRGLRRAYRPTGVARQLLAIAADRNRAAMLERIGCPTLVMHGEADRLVPIACGRDTARRIRSAQFVLVPGMGHDLPPGVCRLLIAQIVPFINAVQAGMARAMPSAR